MQKYRATAKAARKKAYAAKGSSARHSRDLVQMQSAVADARKRLEQGTERQRKPLPLALFGLAENLYLRRSSEYLEHTVCGRFQLALPSKCLPLTVAMG